LYHLACADNVLTEEEIVYIKNVAERLGVGIHELSNFDSSEPELDLPKHEFKIYGLFHRLAIIIMVDNEIHEKERQYCFNLGIRMGLHPNAIMEIIDFVVKHGSMKTTPEEVMGIFKKYMN
jgi:hypothetical protein